MYFIKNLSIKYKLTGIIMLVSCISVISGFALVIVNDIRSFKKDMINNTVVNAKLIGEYCITPLDFGYNTAAVEALNKLQTIPEITVGIVFDENGKVFASFTRYNENGDLPSKPMNGASSYFYDNTLNVYLPIISEGKKYGTVYLKSTTVDLNHKIRNYLITMGSILIGILIVSYISARYLQRIISKPILDLVTTTNTVSQKTDYSVRVQKKGNDEIGILYEGFNNMLQQIDIRDSELRKKSHELQERNLELENFIETSPDAIIITDSNGIIRMVNQQFAWMCGATVKENIIGRNLSEFIEPCDYGKLSITLDHVIQSGRTSDIELHIQRNGYDLPVEMNSSFIINKESPTRNMIHIIRDVSERKLLEDNIKKLRKEYEAFMRHEIKNILFPIQGNVEVLLFTQNDKLDNEQIEYLKAIHENVLHAGRLIDNLKRLQDIEQGKYILIQQKRSLKSIIEKAIDNLYLFAEENKVSIKFHFDSSIPEVLIDDNLVPGVFYNLIKNAIEHVRNCEKSDDRIVEIYVRTDDNRIEITINNKGERVPSDKLELFFEKFNTDREKKKTGTGLGTTYAYLVSKAHGWDIKVDSSERVGTTVTIIIKKLKT